MPPPDYLQYVSKSNAGFLPTAGLLTMTGCPFKCNFCSYRYFSFALRPKEEVLRDISVLVDQYGVRNIHIHDSNFPFNRRRAQEILAAIEPMAPGTNLHIKSRFDLIDEGFLERFRAAGGKSIFFGLESGSTAVLSNMNKLIPIEKVKSVAKATKRLGIGCYVFVILGYPEETRRDIRATYDLLREIEPAGVYCSITKFYPGTPLYEDAIRRGIMFEESWLCDQRFFFAVGERELELLYGLELLLNKEFGGPAPWAEYDLRLDDVPSTSPAEEAIAVEKARRLLA